MQNVFVLTLSFLSIFMLSGRASAQTFAPDRESSPTSEAAMDGLVAPPLTLSAPPGFESGPPGALLIDRSHGANFDIHTFVEALESQGWTADEFSDGPLTLEVLQMYDVLIVPNNTGGAPTPAFTAAEIAAVKHYLEPGAGLWLFHEYDSDATGVNSLASALGVEFQHSIVVDPVDHHYGPSWPYIRDLEPHPINAGVSAVRLMGGCCLTASPPAEVAAYAGVNATGESCQDSPPVLAVQSSIGRVVFSCDITLLHPNYFDTRLTEDEARMLGNIIQWLRDPQAVANESESLGTIKGRFRRGGSQ